MAKQIYIDENGNENLVSGTINYGSLLPMSPSDTDKVADRITALEKIEALTINNVASIVTSNGCSAYNVGGLFVVICFSIQVNTNITSWTPLFDIINAPTITASQFGVVSDSDTSKNTYITAIYSGSTITVRAPNGFMSGVTYRGQMILPIV